MALRITVLSIPVADQDAALAIYRDRLGFVPKHDIDMGGGARWLTLVSPDDPDGPEILLEPNADYPAIAALRASLRADGIPWTQFGVTDLDAEHARLTAAGVTFVTPPTDMGGARLATFDDGCGNLISIVQAGG